MPERVEEDMLSSRPRRGVHLVDLSRRRRHASFVVRLAGVLGLKAWSGLRSDCWAWGHDWTVWRSSRAMCVRGRRLLFGVGAIEPWCARRPNSCPIQVPGSKLMASTTSFLFPHKFRARFCGMSLLPLENQKGQSYGLFSLA